MTRILHRIAGLALSIIAMMIGTADAGTLSTSAIFSQFNAVIFGNFSSTSVVEGRTAVGGNLVGGTTFALNPAGAAGSAFSAWSVYGSATAGANFISTTPAA